MANHKRRGKVTKPWHIFNGTCKHNPKMSTSPAPNFSQLSYRVLRVLFLVEFIEDILKHLFQMEHSGEKSVDFCPPLEDLCAELLICHQYLLVSPVNVEFSSYFCLKDQSILILWQTTVINMLLRLYLLVKLGASMFFDIFINLNLLTCSYKRKCEFT